MAALPTEEELKVLLKIRGPEALACYAWRNAMRALVVFGCRPLKDMWNADSTRHVFSIFRLSFAIYSLSPQEGDLYYHFGGGGKATTVLDACIKACQNAYRYASKAVAEDIARAVAYSARTAEDSVEYAPLVSVHSDAYAAAETAAAAANEARDIFVSAARADYFWLYEWGSFDDWLSFKLWRLEKPVKIKLWEDNVYESLEQLGLGFVMRDLQEIWNGENAHRRGVFKKYLGDISQAELGTAQSIERFVLRKEALTESYAVRAVLLGPGGAGKSSLFKLLDEETVERGLEPTVGVSYRNHKPINLYLHRKRLESPELKDKLTKLQLFLWDFGGQAIFHSLHNAFMHENCVYILVVDSRHEQAPDEWLAQIDSVTQGKGKVILVTNQFDNITGQQNQVSLLRRFSRILRGNSFYHFSCLDCESNEFSKFFSHLVATCVDSQRQVFELTDKAIRETKRIFDEGSQFVGMDVFKYKLQQALPEASIERIDELVGSLREFGRYVSVHEEDEDLCLRPEWVVNKSYELLNHPDILKEKGTIDELQASLALMDPAKPEEDIRVLAKKVLGFLVTQEVCVALDNGKYFLPDAASPNEPSHCQEVLNDQNAFEFFYELKYLPIGVKAKIARSLILNESIEIDVTKDVWRDGVFAQSANGDSKLVLIYQSRRGRIQLTVSGSDNANKAELLQTVDEILAGLIPRNILGSLQLAEVCERFDGFASERLHTTVQDPQAVVAMLQEAAEKHPGKTINIYVNSHIDKFKGDQR